MRLNKREQLALHALDKIAEALSGGATALLSQAEANALQHCLGFDIWESTTPKGEINALVRGKDIPVVLLVSPIEPTARPPRNCFFPFQIKEYDSKLITCPRCHSRKRVARMNG
ncbi:hypothetical protein QKW35_13540 [Pontibacterium granulatum]|uniref:hypothetical protein n=1 Tax=Pontibacterium granulatum TaxID=2036029 RepID=UPI002499E3A3|nr:hypothetical protein [Pontibacterium granulatum]MDI3325400.1 hypothetical protein [Pontibacterium granulatum]